MAKPLVSDALWELIAPLLPIPPDKGKGTLGGRPRLDDRKCLTGILFVLKTGIPWEHLPQEMGCGSGMTCWRRLEEWQQAGVWQALHARMLDKLEQAHKIDWSRACIDSASVAAPHAKRGRRPPRKNPRRRLAPTPRIGANSAASAMW